MTRPGRGRRSPECAVRAFLSSQTKRPGRGRPARLRRNPVKAPSFDRLSRAFARTSPHLRCAGARPAGYISDAGDAPGDAETEAKRGGSKACQKGRKKVAKGWEIAVNLSLFVRICRILRKFPRGFLRPGGNPPQKRPRPENSPAAPVGAIPKRKRERRNEEERRPQAASAENPVPGLRQNPGLSRRGAFSPPLFFRCERPGKRALPEPPLRKDNHGGLSPPSMENDGRDARMRPLRSRLSGRRALPPPCRKRDGNAAHQEHHSQINHIIMLYNLI